MAYSHDLRLCALHLMSEGQTVEQVSFVLNIGTATLWRWRKRHREGSLETRYGSNRNACKIDEAQLVAYIDAHPDAYQREIGEAFGVTQPCIHAALRRLKITRKKRHPVTGSAMKSDAARI